MKEITMTTLLEITEKIKQLQAEADAILNTERKAAIDEIRQKMDAHKLTIHDIAGTTGTPKGATKKSSNPAPVKYRGPNGETWSGRGLMPRWLVALEGTGRNRSEFLIAE